MLYHNDSTKQVANTQNKEGNRT